MKRRLFLRNFALLVAIVLTVTTAFSNYNFVKAADNDVTENTESNKELVQCSDDWVIFKYKDENGDPQFDVKYQGKTVKELEQLGLKLQYFIIIVGDPMPFYIDKWIDVETKEQLNFSENKYQIRFRIIDSDNNTIINTSDAFSLEDNDTYVSRPNIEYFYDITKKSNKFKLELKVNKYLEQIDTLSISVTPNGYGANVDNILSSATISNINLMSYSNKYDIDGETYQLEYSIISCDIVIPPSLDLPSDFDDNTGEPCEYMIGYTLSFNGFSLPIENFLFITNTPTFINQSDSKLIDYIQLVASSSNIKANTSISLVANILPDNATNKKLNWSSSNFDYATVDENGKVTAKSAGAGKSVTITAKSTDGSNVEGKYTLNILPETTLVKTIKIIANSSNVNAGKAITLKAIVNSDATNKTLTWSSSNPDYAIVDKDGVVTTKSAGAGKTVTIIAKSTDGGNISTSFNLRINKILVTKIKLKAQKSVKVGKKLKIKLTINSNATNKAVKWSVSNKKYAKINSKGVLTAKKAGRGKTIKVTAKAKDGSGKKTTIKIKIKK